MKDNLQRSFITEENKDQALVGCLLGDSSFEKTAINIMHSIIHEDYVKLKYCEFSKYFLLGKMGVSSNWGSNPNPELRKAMRFRIRKDENRYSLNDFREIMLDENGKRRIPVEYLDELMTPECLFFWFFDDGQLIVRRPTEDYKHFRRRLAITLKSFKDSEILQTMEFLNRKYGLDLKCEREKDKILRIQTSSVEGISRFMEILLPFRDFTPMSMSYKLNPCFKESSLQHLNFCG